MKLKFACALFLISCPFAWGQTLPNQKEGALFLRTSVSHVTDTGVIGLLPGTEVTKVGETKGKVKVKTLEGMELLVHDSQLTSDPEEAHRLAQGELQSQAATKAMVAEGIKEQQESEARSAAIISSQAPVVPPAAPKPSSSLTQTSSIKYEAEKVNVTVHPPTLKKKKGKGNAKNKKK